MRLLPLTLCAMLIGACQAASATVWVESQSASDAAFFVTDGSDTPAAWYVVPAGTTAHVGSAELGSGDVRVNVLGWLHEVNGVGPCAPGDYDDTLDDVAAGSAVRLLIEPNGRPSVSLAPEPPDLPALTQEPLGSLVEAERCGPSG